MPRMRAAPTATLVAVTGSAGVRLTAATGVVVGDEVGPALADVEGVGVGCGSPVDGTSLSDPLGLGSEPPVAVGVGVGVGVDVGVGVGVGAT
jgi:hypothetical protein